MYKNEEMFLEKNRDESDRYEEEIISQIKGINSRKGIIFQKKGFFTTSPLVFYVVLDLKFSQKF